MHPYTIIKNEVVATLDSSWVIAEEKLHSDNFGSYHCVLSNGTLSIRLIWDGRDGWGYAQEMKSNEWSDLPIFLTEMDMEGVPQNREKISEFCASIKNV
jgi:hypothetical protein